MVGASCQSISFLLSSAQPQASLQTNGDSVDVDTNARNGVWFSKTSLLSLLEMLRFYASAWSQIIRDIELLRSELNIDVFTSITQGQSNKLLEPLARIVAGCRGLGMEFSASYAEKMMANIQQKTSLRAETKKLMKDMKRFLNKDKQKPRNLHLDKILSPEDFRREIAILRERLDDELKGQQFFVLEAKRVQYFERPYLFGEEVFNKFPSANNEITEAGTCLALERGTASVMHLMRVVEVGLKVLATTLNLPARNDWGKYLNDIEKELEKRYKSSGARTPDEQFFSEAAAQIGHIKTAWRNPTMHVDKSYSPDRAEDILLAVKSFMKHLETKLHE